MTVKVKPMMNVDTITSQWVVESERKWVEKGRRDKLELRTSSCVLEVKVKEARRAPMWKDLMVQVKGAAIQLTAMMGKRHSRSS